MEKIELNREEYRDKVFGCWLGKNIGGTLGTPHEGKKDTHDFTFYTPVPEKALPNDDLDIQLAWLKMLEDKTNKIPSFSDFADCWLKYLASYPWDEYGFCMRNLARGLRPPISGVFENSCIDNMGSPIRSEIWACIAPADPQLAASFAYRDAVLDHAGGEGIYGEMFWAAVESAAFVVNDAKTLIKIGLEMIPLSCHISRVVREALWCYENGKNYQEARERVSLYFSNSIVTPSSCAGYAHPCFAPPNHGFTIIGWLYGKDFGDRLCKAVNCGYDTDCTGATLGSVLGIIGGAKNIPQEWRKPIGENIVLHKLTGNCNSPKTVEELTERTVRIAADIVKKNSDVVSFSEKTVIPPNMQSLLFRNEKARKIIASYEADSTVKNYKDLEIIFHYNGEPVLYPGIEKQVGVTLRKDGEDVKKADIEIRVPEHWSVRRLKDYKFSIYSDRVGPTNEIQVSIKWGKKRYLAKFVILGPDEAKGLGTDQRVKVCPKCNARIEACVCNK